MYNLDVLEIVFEHDGIKQAIFPVVLSDKDEMVLIDCGYPHFLPVIKEAAEKKDLDLNRLTKVIITHHDFDHMGSLAQIKREYPDIKILASIHDQKYISGEEKSLRLQQAEALYHQLSPGEQLAAKGFHRMLEDVETSAVDVGLNDSDYFPWCGGVEIIETPGHMPGHLSVYVKELKTLVAGDAVVVEDDLLVIANPQYTMNMVQAKQSIEKLLKLDIDTIVCYHGGVYTKDIKESLERIVSTE